ncbi:MAG: hypothetical protein M1820_002709 [Bogoriella megaspora]|nr:MAG: hypothetical protein M1820_002709 [Bogoriella megaspora]
MKTRNILRTFAQPQLCIFCSLGFTASPLPPVARRTARCRRFLNTSRSPFQSAAAAVAEQDDPRDYVNQSQQNWDNRETPLTSNRQHDGRIPQSSLSPAEERARQALLGSSRNASSTLPHPAQGGAGTLQSRPALTSAEQQARQNLIGRNQTGTQSDPQTFSRAMGSSGNEQQEGQLRIRRQFEGRQSAEQTNSPRFKVRFTHHRGHDQESQDSQSSFDNANWSNLQPRRKRDQDRAPPNQNNSTITGQSRTQGPFAQSRTPARKPREFREQEQFITLGGQQVDKNNFYHQRFSEKKCFRCGGAHLVKDCPKTSPFQSRENAPKEVEERRSAFKNTARSTEGEQSTSENTSAFGSLPSRWDSSVSSMGRDTRKRDSKEKGRRRARFVMDDDGFEEQSNTQANRKAMKAQRDAEKAAKKAQGAPIPLYVPAFISVANLATLMKVRTEQLLGKLAELGFGDDITPDEVMNAENAGLVAMEYNYEAIPEADPALHDLFPQPEPDDKSLLPLRPPVVTIMGHVDHGKTTILDYLRKSSIAASEFGGITQHIGAFSVPLASGKLITFLDTPGHSAFEVMRKRGATVTDIVILVVAADESVKPQTIEAIKHAHAASVPIIVAVNKMDKEGANPERVKGDLARNSVDVEDFGGETQVVCVSGKTGDGIGELEESVVTLSEILDHRAETSGMVEGWVLEATTKKHGRVATVLVKRGTLKPGDIIVAGTSWARARVLRNEAGVEVRSAAPGTPIEVDGWRTLPSAGDQVLQALDETKAGDVVAFRQERVERAQLAKDMEAINEARRLEQEKREKVEAAEAARAEAEANGEDFQPVGERNETRSSGPEDVNFLVKGDVAGSVEAVLNSISALAYPEVRPHILRSGVGPVSEFDVEHAAAADGHIVCFNTTIEPGLMQQAERNGVGLIEQNIIYRLVDEVKAKLSEKLKPLVTLRVLGEAEVSQSFEISLSGKKKMKIAGCKVRNGVVSRTAKVRVLRGDREVIFDGSLNSLKNVKKDVSEMRKGNECGMGFEGWEDFEVGDQVQCYEEKVEKRTL